jgi:hypothetical protein
MSSPRTIPARRRERKPIVRVPSPARTLYRPAPWRPRNTSFDGRLPGGCVVRSDRDLKQLLRTGLERPSSSVTFRRRHGSNPSQQERARELDGPQGYPRRTSLPSPEWPAVRSSRAPAISCTPGRHAARVSSVRPAVRAGSNADCGLSRRTTSTHGAFDFSLEVLAVSRCLTPCRWGLSCPVEHRLRRATGAPMTPPPIARARRRSLAAEIALHSGSTECMHGRRYDGRELALRLHRGVL